MLLCAIVLYFVSQCHSHYKYTFAGADNWRYQGDGGPATSASACPLIFQMSLSKVEEDSLLSIALVTEEDEVELY
jgi:hypothetical protein